MAHTNPSRRLPIGAEVQPAGKVHFRVWAPGRRTVAVVLEDGGGETLLEAERHGYFSGLLAAAVGAGYRYRLDGDKAYPDPASRYQPDGPHGPSQVVDPGRFAWTDQDWHGCERDSQFIYELHIGTFTPEGTWAAAAVQLPFLAELGITIVEVMPVADFSGRFGWGYDGVDLYAPTRLYGTPDDFRRFVDRAHALRLGVILDVVYNHLGPDGCYLSQFAPAYFTDRHKNDWGTALNFDGDDAGPVREFFIANAGYWIDEFHLDGLRLDATQQIHDSSPEHVITAMGKQVRNSAHGRATIVIAENETQESRLVRSLEAGGYGLDMIWNDDYHHSAMTVLTGHNEAYYSDYLGTPQEFISAAKWGFLFQGQRYQWQKKRRGSPTFGLDPVVFVNFLENHDQVSNSAYGLRGHQLTSPGRWRALSALTILMPGTPMLFQGQEFAASSPFLYFADHGDELAQAVRKGRGEFLGQFPSVALPQTQAQLADPASPATFERCKLDLAEREANVQTVALYRDLIRLRRGQLALRAPKRGDYDGAVLGPEAFVLRFFHDTGDRLLAVNLGRDLLLSPAPEPLLAPPAQTTWDLIWSSEDARYGGLGALHPETDDIWRLPGNAAVVLAPQAASR